jgi:acyl carrier protein
MNMNTETVKRETSDFIKENTFADVSKLADDTFIFRDGFFDSMGFVSLISFLESKFSIQIDEDDLVEENFESINAITSFVMKKNI